MTQQEHLSRIRAKCVELLEIAAERTKGNWAVEPPDPTSLLVLCGDDVIISTETIPCEPYHKALERRGADARFIAACAGPAEAGWKATIAAIDGFIRCKNTANLRGVPFSDGVADECERQLNTILAAWPEETL